MVNLLRVCSKCGVGHPPTNEYFMPHSSGAVCTDGVKRYRHCRNCMNEWNREWMRKSPKRKATLQRWKERNQEKQRAVKMLNKKIENGLIERGSCEVCGKENAHAHHEDYSMPFEVIWLCPLHHKEHHKNKELA